MATICVYGDFSKKDVRVKVVRGNEQFVFQNTLQSAGYDALLFTISDEELKGAHDGK